MHEEVLNYMLANICYNEAVEPWDGTREFTFDLHCVEVVVIARFVGSWTNDDIRYEIISWRTREI